MGRGVRRFFGALGFVMALGASLTYAQIERTTFMVSPPQLENQSPKTFVVCNQQQAAVCQRQARDCDKICQLPTTRDKQSCWQGCLNRYDTCKAGAGCRDF